MTKKDFTDTLFKAMYEFGYRKAEIVKGRIFFYKEDTLMGVWVPRVPVECTCFTDEQQYIDIGEYIGIIDADYYNNDDNEGHIMIPIRNLGDKPFEYNKNERLAQLIIMPYRITAKDRTTKKRTGGFGSTGNK